MLLSSALPLIFLVINLQGAAAKQGDRDIYAGQCPGLISVLSPSSTSSTTDSSTASSTTDSSTTSSTPDSSTTSLSTTSPPNYCLQCLSSNSRDVEVCIQLKFLIEETGNHKKEEQDEVYCKGKCPIILATAYYYCGLENRIGSLLEVCGKNFKYNEEPDAKETYVACSNSNNDPFLKQCEFCIHQNSGEVRKCLQEMLLLTYLSKSINSLQKRDTFCSNNCPLTLMTSNWYCGNSRSVFADQCSKHTDGTYCATLTETVLENSNYKACMMTDMETCGTGCPSLETQFGCCLKSMPRLQIHPDCLKMKCTMKPSTGQELPLLSSPFTMFLFTTMALTVTN